MEKLKILLADDHPIFKVGLISILKTAYPDSDYYECNDGKEAWEKIQEITPHVVILDIDIPQPNGLELSALISEHYPNIRIIMLTIHKEPSVIKKAYQCGAHGYILKEDSHIELIGSIQELTKSDYRHSSTMQKMKNKIQDLINEEKREVLLLDSMSKIEKKVIYLIMQCFSSKEIAEKLHIAPKTVDNHRSRICNKLKLPPENNSLLRWVMSNKELIEEMNAKSL